MDSGGNAYITGLTSSTNFPTVNPLQPTFSGNEDAFVTKIASVGPRYSVCLLYDPTKAVHSGATVPIKRSSGKVTLAGLGRGFGPWTVFGAVGSINQTSVNSYRTDIQIKLEDESGQKAFLNYSLPFAITLAIEPGESVRIYFVKGGLQKPTAPGDLKVDSWTAFVAENIDTGQLIPIAGLPTLASPKKGLLAVAVIGVLFTFLLMAAQAEASSVIFSSVITLPFIVAAALRARKYKLALEDATRRAAGAAV